MNRMKNLTISLPDDLERRLQEFSRRAHRTPEEAVRDILRSRLVVGRFHELCSESEVLAKAAGFESENEVLRAIL